MAEEKDTIGRDEPLNEEAPTPQTAGDAADAAPAADAPARAGKFDRLTQDEGGVRKLTGMYKNWFLDYASYVILERAVPHVEDGLKPVQRRILHAMKVVDDGRGYAHKKIYETEDENVGIKAAHRSELVGEAGLRTAYHRHKTAPYRKAAKLQPYGFINGCFDSMDFCVCHTSFINSFTSSMSS